MVKHLPNGGKPPATDDEGLRLLRDSILENDSVSGVVDLLPVPIACDRFYKNIARPVIRRLNLTEQKHNIVGVWNTPRVLYI